LSFLDRLCLTKKQAAAQRYKDGETLRLPADRLAMKVHNERF